jgi:hypothetical protein
MKVHVIRDNGFPVEQYEQVMQLLQATAGLISFVKQSLTIDVIEPEELPVIIEDNLSVDEDGDLVKQENLTKVYPWGYFFHQCATYRQACKISDDEFIIILTPKHNSSWYLAAFSGDTRDVFVKTSEWDAYLECDPIYPTAYTVISQVLLKLYFGDMDRRSNEGHKPAVGCTSDFCKYKHEVIFKFRTADICMDCLKKMLGAGLQQEYFIQAFSLFETVRTEMLFKQRHQFKVAQHRIHIKRSRNGGQGLTVELPDIKKEINLNPKESALYLFYLTQKVGVKYANLSNYQEKLVSIYRELNERNLEKREEQSKDLIERLVKNKSNRDSDLSKMRDKFKDVLGPETAKLYYINGLSKDRDLVKGIRLDRTLVSYDEDVERHLLL